MNKLDEIKKIQEEIEATSKVLVVPKKLINPVPLVFDAERSLKGSSPSNYSRNNGLVSTKNGNLSIRVTPGQVRRALRLFNSIIKLAEERGHTVFIENFETKMNVLSHRKVISLREKTRKVKKENSKSNWPEYNYIPTGVLVFKVGGWNGREWQDSSVLLENKLSNIMAHIEYGATELNNIWKENEKRDRIQQIKKRETQEQLKKEQEDLMDTNALIEDALNWQKSSLLQQYIQEVKKHAIESDTYDDDCKRWVRWAYEKANKLNPLST